MKHNIILLSADGRFHERRTARTDAAVSAAALRVRRSRERRKLGMIVLPPLVIREEVVDYLIDAGLLDRWCESPQIILQAVERLFELLCLKEQRS
jgi:hypothetical protein